MERYALIGSRHALDTVRAYMPTNYTANVLGTFDRRILISGHDNAGWTLDSYVLPRLASGLIFAREVGADEREALLDAARAADDIETINLRGIAAPDF